MVGDDTTIHGRFTRHVQEGSWAHGNWSRKMIYHVSRNGQVTGTRDPAPC